MSGLLPRTGGGDESRGFDNLSCNTLTVASSANIALSVTDTAIINHLALAATALDNTAPDVLALQGTDVVYKTNVADTSSAQTFTNKTIDSAANTITITSAPLAGANINAVLNQDVRTSASPSWVTVNSSSQLLVNATTDTHGIVLDQALNLGQTANSLTVTSAGVGKIEVGHNQQADLSYVWSHVGLRIGTNATERILIPSAGIANDNTITNILGLNGTTLVYKNNIADTSTAQTFTNKTIDSAANTITITSAPLAGANINAVLNQALLTTSSPTFNSLLCNTSCTVSTASGGLLSGLNVTITSTNETGLYIRSVVSMVLIDRIRITYNPVADLAVITATSNTPLVIATNGVERFRILSTGIALDNAAASVLALNGTTLSYRDDLVSLTGTQTLTNKTLDSDDNTITITSAPLAGVNINSLLDQDVRTTATPSFDALDLTDAGIGLSMYGNKVLHFRGEVTTTTNSVELLFAAIEIPTDTTMIGIGKLGALITAGSSAGQSAAQVMTWKLRNSAGTAATGIVSNQFSNDFATGFGAVAVGSTAEIRVTGQASQTIFWYCDLELHYM